MINYFAVYIPYKYHSIFDVCKVATAPTVSSRRVVVVPSKRTPSVVEDHLKCPSKDDHIYDPVVVTPITCSDYLWLFISAFFSNISSHV